MKLPHWAMVAMSLVTVVLAWMMKEQASGDLTLPAAAVTVLSLVSSIIGLFSSSVLAAKPAADAPKATGGAS